MMKRKVLRFVDGLFERQAIIQSLVAPMIVLAVEYWSHVFTWSSLSMAVTFTLLTPTMVLVYVFWDSIETGFEEYFLGETK